jgi:hypothetical protein
MAVKKNSAPYPVKRQAAESMYANRGGKTTTGAAAAREMAAMEKQAKQDRNSNSSWLPHVRRVVGDA